MAITTEKDIHWHKTAGPGPECQPLQDHVEADVVIVGGGLTGTRTALGLAEAGLRVVLLEAQQISYGASGRSGGQCNPIWRATPDDLANRLGGPCADRLVEATLGCADALFADIERYGIRCDHEQNGWVQAAHSKTSARGLERLAKGWTDVGADITMHDRAETERLTGSQAYGFSLFHKRGGFVQPLSLTRGFAHTAIRFGAQLYDHSPATSMTREGKGWRVTTPQGSATAAKVVLATNAYTDALWPKLKQTVFPLVSISLATAPLTDNLQKSVLPNAVTLADTRRAIYYSRYDRDRRLIFGCVGSTEDAATLGGIGRLKRGLRTVFPQLEDTEIEATWAGRIAVTPEMMPHLHEPAPGVLAALGFSGRGIAMTSVMARTVVNKVLGAADDTLPFPVVPIKPIPFHSAIKAAIPLAAPAMTLRDQIDTLMDRS